MTDVTLCAMIIFVTSFRAASASRIFFSVAVSTALVESSKIIILDDGKVHRIGTHAELLADDQIYQEIYASQMKGGDENGSESL